MQVHSSVARLVTFSLFWLALTGGVTDALYHGAPAVLLATWVSLVLYPATQPGIRLGWAVLYVPHLLLRGFWGGWMSRGGCSTHVCRSGPGGSGFRSQRISSR